MDAEIPVPAKGGADQCPLLRPAAQAPGAREGVVLDILNLEDVKQENV